MLATRTKDESISPSASSVSEAVLDIEKLWDIPLKNSPYDFVIVPEFVKKEAFGAVFSDYPVIAERGSFPLNTLTYGPAFEQLLAELQSDAFRAAVEKKFGVDLQGKPTMITVRGKCGTKDGNVHTDTESKIISLLLYMNPNWAENEGGKLRILRSDNLEDYVEEVPPSSGTLLLFRRCDHSYHGHKLFIGERKVVQLNWVTEQKFAERNITRHSWSSWIKKLNPFK